MNFCRHARIYSQVFSKRPLQSGRLQEKLACVASVSVGFRGKELPCEKEAGKILFLGLSLLPNNTETLAMQAKEKSTNKPKAEMTDQLQKDIYYLIS